MSGQTVPLEDATVEYEEAQARVVLIRAEWEEQGKPLLAEGSQGQLVEHPLVKMLRDGEAHAAKLRDKFAKKHRGPEPKAVVQPKIGQSPAAQLRAVK